MKPLLIILFNLVMTVSFGQIANVATSLPATDHLVPQYLAYQLTSSHTTEREKVRAIFTWITDNIAYKVRRFRPRKYNQPIEIDDDTLPLKPLNERVAEIVLKDGEAFCDGYARLFKTLCDYAGIRAEIISGYSSDSRRSPFKSNHSWNAVFIDSSWYLLDATWASGYVTFREDEFIRRYNDHYFLTPPHIFIRDHYPEDLQWTLLPKPPEYRDYQYSPFRFGAYLRLKINAYYPATGIIEARVGDTLNFQIDTDMPDHPLMVADTAFVDSCLVADLVSQATFTRDGNKISVQYVVSEASKDWIHIVYRDEPILRYRLRVVD